eukprot:scaffold113896_cov35-Phaeocystis_antarctica.AAC.4
MAGAGTSAASTLQKSCSSEASPCLLRRFKAQDSIEMCRAPSAASPFDHCAGVIREKVGDSAQRSSRRRAVKECAKVDELLQWLGVGYSRLQAVGVELRRDGSEVEERCDHQPVNQRQPLICQPAAHPERHYTASRLARPRPVVRREQVRRNLLVRLYDGGAAGKRLERRRAQAYLRVSWNDAVLRANDHDHVACAPLWLWLGLGPVRKAPVREKINCVNSELWNSGC